MPPAAFVEIVSASAARGMAFDCAVLRQASGVLARRDENAGRELVAIVETCAAS